MCDEYPIVFDIIWALSFNQDIQQQLRSNSLFMTKLAHPPKLCDDEKMRKTIHGILWNLESNHAGHATSDINDEKTFDIMISYSHKDKILCQQLYGELIRIGYRVWIDFDQMHGNVMDAMAQAIERSNTILICMSEQYRRSNYCRAEAQYAFRRQLTIVPVLLQKHYKPDGWLLFLIGQLLYVDFTKYDFSRAMEMLTKELKVAVQCQMSEIFMQPKQEQDVIPHVLQITPLNASLPLKLLENIRDWTATHVHDWLISHSRVQMSLLLSNCDGRSLVYLDEFIKNGATQEILSLMKEDSLRRTNQSLSLVELSCFRSLMDHHKLVLTSSAATKPAKSNSKKGNKTSLVCCRTM